MLRNDDDLAYIENRMVKCTSTFIYAASQKISGRYPLNSSLCTTYGRPAAPIPALILVLCYQIGQ